MVTLADRLDFIVGSDAAGKLDDAFGIRTVGDLLRHYPRSYVEGTGVRGAADSRPEEGDHITVVDTISSAVLKDMQRRKGKFLAVTVGSGRNKVSATFFNPKGLRWRLTPGTRVMLSGEVKLYRGAIQLTHPDFWYSKKPTAKRRTATSAAVRCATSPTHRRRSAGRSTSRTSNAAATRSIRPPRNCRAGTSSPVSGRFSRCSIRCPTRCRPRCAPNVVCSAKTTRCGDPSVGEGSRTGPCPRPVGRRRSLRSAMGAGDAPAQ